MPYTPIIGTLGYVLSPDGRQVLMVHRNARADDQQLGKYNGLGGKLEPGEDVHAGMRRELMEEAGYGAHRLEVLANLSLSPSYMGNRMTLVLAQELFEKRLPGDEPEPLVASWHHFEELLGLLGSGDLSEGYAIAAMFLARERLAGTV